MSKFKHLVQKIAGTSEGEAKKDIDIFTEGAKKLHDSLISLRQRLVGTATIVNFSIKQMKGVTVEDIIKTNKVQAFSRIKSSNGVIPIQNFYQYGEDIVTLAEQGREVENILRSKANDLNYKDGKHNLHLFDKNERKIEDIAQNMKKHSKQFGDGVFFLQSQEQGLKADANIITKNFEQVHESLKELTHDVHDFTKAFNHALDAAKQFMKDDIRLQAILQEHIMLLEKGEYPQKATDTESAGYLYSKAKGNSKDPLYGEAGGANRATLEKWAKEIDELELKKTG